MDELEKFNRELKEKFIEFDRDLSFAREISRSAIYRIIILSASIVGFSISLFSIPLFQSSLILSTLQYSWYFLLAVVILGFFILMFEGRVKYAKAWKAFQVSQFLKEDEYTIREKICASLITIVSLFYPANLLFNRIYKIEEEKRFKERVNGLVVQKLAGIEHSLIFLENIFIILFICGLVLLVFSFKI